jgi:hypothetical protein
MAFEDLKIEMKCKDFRIEAEEGLKGESLSIAAQDHVAGCRPCREFNQKHLELREWISVCETITAPKDFQFGVQRKIANAGAVHTHSWAWNGLKYIVPTAALVLLTVLTWNFFSSTAQQTGTPLAVMNAEAPPLKDNAAPQPETVTPQIEQQLATAVNKAENTNARVAVPKENPETGNGGGSVVLSASNIPDSVKPQGLHVAPNQRAVQSDLHNSLLVHGIVTDLGMKVIKLTPNAPAGIQVDDVVKGFSGNTITVIRNEQTIQVSLK